VYILVALFLYLLIHFLSRENTEWDLEEVEVELDENPLKQSAVKSSKWIVCTTIYRPTHALRMLSKQLNAGWRMVVVGDRKTPSGWRLSGVTYLSVKTQKSLSYRVLQYLPYDSYTRKVIGYLYAIEHGAQYIYEIDDDNNLDDDLLSSLHPSSDLKQHLVINIKNLTYNPYVHFGQSTMWPRGYPLDRIGLPSGHDYKLCWTKAPSIQQGVVNGDPDVDAIFRLTRRSSTLPLNLTFDEMAPIVVLPQGVYAPFNSQNTLFLRSTFWALFLPVTVGDRVTDIYRAYWAQKLMWLIGENLAFASPRAWQKRSGHRDIQDAREETELYTNIGRYIKVLNEWQCEDKVFFRCVSHLSNHLVTEGLWKKRDAEIIDAWISDLQTIGYVTPVLEKQLGSPCVSGVSKSVVFYAEDQKASMPNTEQLQVTAGLSNHRLVVTELRSRCSNLQEKTWNSAIQNTQKYVNILLVVGVYSDLHKVVPYLEAAYKPHFRHVLYCVNQDLDTGFINKWRISVVKLIDVVGTVNCLSAASQMQYRSYGTLYITEKMWLSSQGNLKSKLSSLVWMTGDFIVYKPETMTLCAARTIECIMMPKDLLVRVVNQIFRSKTLKDATKKSLQKCVTKIEKDPNWLTQAEVVWTSEMAVYLPSRLYKNLEDFREIFQGDSDLMQYDFLTVLFIECEQLTVEYLKHSSDVKEMSDVDYVFPFFFSSIKHVDETRNQFCENFELFLNK